MFACSLGYSYGADLDAAIKAGQIKMHKRVSTTEQSFKMLLHNRTQLFPQEINIGYYALSNRFSKDEFEQITHHSKPFLVNFSHLLFPKKTEKSLIILEKFNQTLRHYKTTGKYDEYFKNLNTGYYALDN